MDPPPDSVLVMMRDRVCPLHHNRPNERRALRAAEMNCAWRARELWCDHEILRQYDTRTVVERRAAWNGALLP
jgi:hypothetical protein